MAITPADWSRRVQITEINTSPALSGYVALLTESNLPAEIWSTAINGGGDLRVCLNSDGTSQLPLEVVSFDTVAETGVLWVRFPTFASGDSLWLFYGKAGETQPIVTDTFGRNAVWSDYEIVSHDGLTDSSGNHTFTNSGAIATDGFISGGIDVSGGAYTEVALTYPENQSVTIQSWVKPDVSMSLSGVAGFFGSTLANNFMSSMVRNNAAGTIARNGGNWPVDIAESTATLNTTRFYKVSSTFTTTEYLSDLDGGNRGSTSASYGAPVDYDRFSIGGLRDSSPGNFFDGKISEVTVSKFELSQDHITTEYENQASPATFWSIGTPEDTGGGGGGLVITTVSIPSAESVGSPILSAGTVVISPEAIASAEALGNPTISQGATFITPLSIDTEEFVRQPIVTPQGVIITPIEIPTEALVGNPEVSVGLAFILPEEIATQEFVGEPDIDLILKQIFPDAIASLLSVGRPLVLGGDRIIIPIESRVTWNAVAKYLRELVFTGADNDVIMKWLRSEGFDDAYNDNWEQYLKAAGFLSGAMSDKYALWRRGINGVDPWILSDGTWDDSKIWQDLETWRDS